jgi:heterotetrameric sarcosine oxidase gamma subunit
MTELKPLEWRSLERDFGFAKLRIDAVDVASRLAAAMRFPAPMLPNTFSRGDGVSCANTAPGEWIVFGDAAPVGIVLERVRRAFRDDNALLLDMSDGAVAIRLTGARGVDRIAAYCDLDLHADAFPTGSAARTRFGDIAATLVRLDDRPSFLLIADQSYTDYLDLLIRHGIANG